MKRLILAAALVLLPAAPALAQDAVSAHLSDAFKACYGRAGNNVVQRDVCAQREVGAQDDRLNKAYQQVMHQLAKDPAAHTALRDEERRWISERDYACKINGDTVDVSCVVLKTALRADELERRIHF
ncbi:MAG TPA: lysozyme inhibitor LprI family protein [Rhizomicrobium sp.]|nr:lysozyme inhibitor LprI family protein [Rhizomicrobium sp.]